MPRTPESVQQGYPQDWENWTVGKREKWYYDLGGKESLRKSDTPHKQSESSRQTTSTERTTSNQRGLNPLQERLRRDALADLSKPFKRNFPTNIPQGKTGS